jgi:predicted enzyme related to lactoylglutathione lyase
MLFALAITSGILCGQTPPAAPNAAPAGDVVIGSGSFSPIVQDLERSLRFYNDLVGNPAPATIPAFGTDPALLNFLGTPTGQVRVGTVRIPGSPMTVEIVEFKDVTRNPVHPRVQDPGAVRLILIVRSLDALLDRLKAGGASVISAGGSAVTLRSHDAGRAALIQDPDGFFIELLQPAVLPASNAPAASNVIGARFGLTIGDTDQTMKVYRDLLGFQPQIDAAFSSDTELTNLLNTPGAQVRRSTATVPGSALQVEFLEFKGIDRRPLDAHIQDPGATRFQLRVRDSDATVKTLAAAGGSVITTGGDGGPILMSGLRIALVREPNNLFLVIMTAAPRPAR